MIERKVIIDKLVNFLNDKLTIGCETNPLMIFIKPFIARSLNNNIRKIDNALKFVADEKGMVDIEGIIDDTVNNLLIFETKKYPNIFNGIEVGEGNIKINIPFINKDLLITTDDIEEFKKQLIKK